MQDRTASRDCDQVVGMREIESKVLGRGRMDDFGPAVVVGLGFLAAWVSDIAVECSVGVYELSTVYLSIH